MNYINNFLISIIKKFKYFQNFQNFSTKYFAFVYFIPIFCYYYYMASHFQTVSSDTMKKTSSFGINHFFTSVSYTSLSSLKTSGYISSATFIGIVLSYFIVFILGFFLYYQLLRNFETKNFKIKLENFWFFVKESIRYNFSWITAGVLYFLIISTLFLIFVNINNLVVVLSTIFFVLFVIFFLFYTYGLYIKYFIYISNNKIEDNKYWFVIKNLFNIKKIIMLNLRLKNFIIPYLWYLFFLKILSSLTTDVFSSYPVIYAIIETFIDFFIVLNTVSFMIYLYDNNKEIYEDS